MAPLDKEIQVNTCRRALPLLLCFLVLATARPAGAATTMLLGVYYGNQGWKMDQVQALESWQGKPHAIVTMFTSWNSTSKTLSNLFGQQLPNIWNNGNVPMVTREPSTGAATPANIDQPIARRQGVAYGQPPPAQSRRRR